MTLTVLPERLFSRTTPAESGCWLWGGWTNKDGYGYVRVDGRDQPVHRVAWTAVNGPIPSGLELDHTCQTRSCLNPAHLEPVTHAENQRRIKDRQTACRKYGHDWSVPRNVYFRADGRRYCRECERVRRRKPKAVASC